MTHRGLFQPQTFCVSVCVKLLNLLFSSHMVPFCLERFVTILVPGLHCFMKDPYGVTIWELYEDH